MVSHVNAQEGTSAYTPSEIWWFALPFIDNYTPEVYGENPQNWTFLENKEGLPYVGNTSGVLEFDGNSWKRIQLSNNCIARSLAINREGFRQRCGRSWVFGSGFHWPDPDPFTLIASG